MSANTIIKIYRSSYPPCDSVGDAILKLDRIYQYRGVLCMVDYYTSPEKNAFDTVFASGVRDGIGRDCYRIISLRQDNIVWGAGTFLPDVSRLVHGEKYLYYQESIGKWWIVCAPDGKTRQFLELPTVPTTYECLADNTQWVVDTDQKARRLTNIYTRNEIDYLIEDVKNTVRYVDFESLTPTQIEKLRGDKGEQGDKGDPGPIGLQGNPGPRGYNGTIENFVVLSESEYERLTYIDPYKFYFTYDDSETPIGEFDAHVEGTVLVINPATVDELDSALEIDQEHANYDDSTNTLDLITEAQTVLSPMFTPTPGTYDGVITVEISCQTPGSEIYYTLDYTEPTRHSYQYTGPLTLDSSTVIKARAFKPGYLDSAIVTAQYDLIFSETVGTPVLSPEGGNFIDQQQVTAYCTTPDAMIRYTLDGTEPNSASPLYTEPLIARDLTTIIRVKGFKEGYNASSTSTGIYIIGSHGTVGTPKFSIRSGTYSEPQEVIIYSNTPGSIIRYTLDGTDPDSNSEIFTDLITITTSTVIKAKAFKEGMVSSNIGRLEVIIQDSPTPPTPIMDVEVNGQTLIDYTDGDSVLEGIWTIIPTSPVIENKTLIL